ncbi:MAG: thioredoxin domain-containing protein [Candidatus Tectomicrobia bacterium]|uniref:Thioredoxin domain-containing protein n=1 Tax=Tectimicrobiota bacterium TaxID=2528274 RepID=A0A932CM45_UNCTE|nr:thioredoxin domain-containing protein [Candidatus Tectomicrobia bacterium]
MLDRLQEEYSGKIRVEVHHMPWSTKSAQAAEAALCAADQGKFWEYHKVLFNYQEQWSAQDQPKDSFIEYAGYVGLNKQEFTNCTDSHKMLDKVIEDKNYGQSLDVHMTPTIFINQERIVGNNPIDTYNELIDRNLKEKI